MILFCLILLTLLCSSLPLHAQWDAYPDSLFFENEVYSDDCMKDIHSLNSFDLTLSAESSLGDGPYSPYYLVSNRHGLLEREANTGYIRANLEKRHAFGRWSVKAGLDLMASVNARSSFSIHQAYVSLSLDHHWNLTIGAREQDPLLRDFHLSSGSMLWSGNARPIPQVHLGTNTFLTLPHTGEWLEIFFDMHYGRYVDDEYLEDEYAQYVADKSGYGRSWITTHVWSHQKRGYIRTNHRKPWVFTLGGEHAVQFGGNTRNALDPALADVQYPPSFTDFLRVLLPIEGGTNAADGDKNFKYGNHIGIISALLEYQWGYDRQYKIGIYGEDLFEDGSGIRKLNGGDGLWGIEYHNRNKRSCLSGVVFEYLQTTDQSGPIHWAPGDFSGQDIASAMPHEATGMDDYYNNYFYTGYSHFGFACGSPMLKSPAFNSDHYLRFTDNRVRAWHLGMEGCLCNFSTDAVFEHSSRLDYRLLFSYRESYGTYFFPHPELVTSYNALFELNYHLRKFNLSAGYAFDYGELYGNNHAFSIRCAYHFSFDH